MGEIARASRRLTSEGFAFMLSNNDCQITMFKGDETVDFWPSTGLWWIRSARNKRRGIETLIQYMKKENKK